jgi:hypothetical protein
MEETNQQNSNSNKNYIKNSQDKKRTGSKQDNNRNRSGKNLISPANSINNRFSNIISANGNDADNNRKLIHNKS